jgi:hypothetical protein
MKTLDFAAMENIQGGGGYCNPCCNSISVGVSVAVGLVLGCLGIGVGLGIGIKL